LSPTASPDRRSRAAAISLLTRVAAAAAVLVWLFVAALAPSPVPPAQAAPQNAAAVVVDDGTRVSTFCVRFSSDSISGVEALQATGLPVVTRAFGGMGAAICSLGGTGCGSGTDCLTCRAPLYWAYHRQNAAADGFTRSNVGAGSTRVTNGTVEGWKFGTGEAPEFRTFASVCSGGSGGANPATTSAPTSLPAGTDNNSSRGTSGAAGAGTASGGGVDGQGQATASADPAVQAPAAPDAGTPAAIGGEAAAGLTAAGGSGASGDSAVDAAAAGYTDDAAATSEAGTGSSAGILGWSAFAATLAALVAAIVAVRLRRNR